ncbi:aminotransferase class IV [Fulvivirga lutimaris]|uniref:aminotransferase class IV n=1 Tax=Fulvivirga lutimaris TaxID=1819566 RepID=UPI00162AF2A8|nr:aminotransferase class IV [Fulvivirga lutimaris]
MNDNIIDDRLTIGLDNRAIQFGDGLFETIIANKTSIPLLKLHYDRLRHGIKSLSLNLDLSLADFESKIMEVIEANGTQEFNRAKVLVWRGSESQQGYYSGSEKADILISSRPCNKPTIRIIEKAAFSKNVKLAYHSYSALKTISALPYTMAAIERKNSKLDELILTDGNGYISECVSSNIFWVKDNQLYTSNLKSGCVAGVMRQHLMNMITAKGIILNEVMAQKEELLAADFIFTTNVAEIGIIEAIDNNSYLTNNPLFEDIKQLLEL